MDSEGNLSGNSSGELPKILKDQTNVSTGIGPTGTDTPAPKDLMLHCDQMEHSLKEPLSRPPGALFQVGSGLKGDQSEKIPEPISEFSFDFHNLKTRIEFNVRRKPYIRCSVCFSLSI